MQCAKDLSYDIFVGFDIYVEDKVDSGPIDSQMKKLLWTEVVNTVFYLFFFSSSMKNSLYLGDVPRDSSPETANLSQCRSALDFIMLTAACCGVSDSTRGG